MIVYRCNLDINMDYSSLSEPLLLNDPSPQLSLCTICFTSYANFSFPDCGHSFCKDCLSTYLEISIKDGNVLKIQCPALSCPLQLSRDHIQELSSEDIFQKYHEFYERKQLELNINFRWCPQRGCSGYDVYSTTNQLACNACSHQFCFLCGETWHFSEKCKEEDGRFLNWVSARNVKKCPECRMNTEKNGGCPHMTCARCGYEWCWICQKSYVNHSELTCFAGNTIVDVNWYVIVLMVLFPVVFPWILLIMFRIAMHQEGNNGEDNEEYNGDRMAGFMIRNSTVITFGLIILSPIIVPLSIGCGILVIGFGVAAQLAPYKHNQNLVWGVFLLAFVLSVAAIVMAIVGVLIALTFCLTPVAGIVLLLLKIGNKIFRIAS